MINSGDLDRRLVIEAPVETADDAGGVVRGYADAATVWASVRPETMRADVEADAAGAALGYRILMRAGRDLTTRHCLRDGAQRYRIPPALQANLALLGVGTTADATNPLAAKLNNALFAAKTVAEGGDGHLRYKLSKESAGKTLSFLFQDNYSGRAEIGLTGDDCFHFKISPDGVTWSDALVLDGSTGARINLPTTVQVDAGTALTIDLQEGNGVFQATRYANSSNAPVFFGRKARGTRASPSAVQAGDTLIGFRGYGYTGASSSAARRARHFCCWRPRTGSIAPPTVRRSSSSRPGTARRRAPSGCGSPTAAICRWAAPIR